MIGYLDGLTNSDPRNAAVGGRQQRGRRHDPAVVQMTVPDYPPGEWSVLLVGAQWVSITSVTALHNAIANRGTIQTNFSQLHDTLQQAITTTLAGQEGKTADAIRDAFRQGADQAAHIAEKNGTYKKALQGALDSVMQLRDKLTGIAKDGNQKINDILKSNDKPEIKVTKIVQAIAECQRQANQAAADCAFSIIGDGQKVVDAQGTGQSFFGMARDAGIDANQQPNLQAIEDQVRGKLNQSAPQGTPASAPRRWRRGSNHCPESTARAPPPAPASRRPSDMPPESTASGTAGRHTCPAPAPRQAAEPLARWSGPRNSCRLRTGGRGPSGRAWNWSPPRGRHRQSLVRRRRRWGGWQRQAVWRRSTQPPGRRA